MANPIGLENLDQYRQYGLDTNTAIDYMNRGLSPSQALYLEGLKTIVDGANTQPPPYIPPSDYTSYPPQPAPVRVRVPREPITLQGILGAIRRALIVVFVGVAVIAAVMAFSPAIRSEVLFLGAQTLSSYNSSSPERKVSFYEALRPVPLELKKTRASVLYTGLKSSGPAWQSLSDVEQGKVAAAWLRYRADQGAFKKLPAANLNYYRAAFDSYLSHLLVSLPDPRIARDLAALRLSDLGGKKDFDGFLEAIQLGQSYTNLSSAKESMANMFLKWAWLAKRKQGVAIP